MKLKYFLLAILWPVANSYAQSLPSNIRPLKIGDTVPDIEFANVINYPVSKIRLSDFKGKLLILDFWATWCGSCISTFAKTDSLQEQFSNQLQFIMVNSIKGSGDSESRIKAFFKKWNNKNHNSIHMPFAIEDIQAKEFFPYTYVPHYVWIGGNHKVLAITSAEAITKANIQKALKGSQLNLCIKEQ